MAKRLIDVFWSNPWLLMFLTTLSWASNVICSKLAVGEISPMVLGGIRWPIAALMVLPFVGRHLRAASAAARGRWLYLLAMGGFGFTGYSALFYTAGAFTTGLNFSILLATTPVFTVAFAWAALRARMPAIFLLGLAMTFAGALLIATHGDLAGLKAFSPNRGDLLILCACAIYACFSIALRNRPVMHPLAFFVALCIAATIVAVPLIVAEWALGGLFWPSAMGWAVFAYSVVLPTVMSQIFYIRSVELIGPQRTGLFYNLVPVLGALMSIVVLHEPVAVYHGVALLLVLGGISIAETFRAKGREPQTRSSP